jgi:nicotinate-nucleotide pyrophosphorylase
MNTILSVLMITAPLVGACAASLPPPTQRLADAQSSERSAREVGANNVPAAKLSLKLANDQIAQAQKAMADGDNVEADMLLVRAKADSELALAQARESGAVVEHKEAIADSAEQKTNSAAQGAVK